MEVKEKLLSVICNKFGMDEIQENEVNEQMASFDSLDHIDLLYAIEDAFNIKLPVDRSFKDCDDITKLITEVSNNSPTGSSGDV